MRSEKPLTAQQRRARFEFFEERLAMSAQPLNDLTPDAALGIPLEQHYAELTSAPGLELPVFQVERIEQVEQLLGSDVGPVAAGVADDLTGVTGVRANYGLTGKGQTVAVIDSGIAYDHRALGGGFGQGYRVVGGWDFAENDANPYDDGPAGFHGTHVAGIVGSSDATYRGVASGVDLVALRVFDDQGNGNFGWVEQALQWVHQNRSTFANPITTVNLSLGTSWNSDAPPNWAMLEDEFAQLKQDGILISVSAGNSFQSFNAPGLSYPAASSYVIPVSSVDNNGAFSSFSQRNSRVIAAPGRSIVSTVPDYVTGSDGVPNDFAAASGTSMAAPYLAGASALVREAMQIVGMNNVTQDTIYNHLRSTADVFFDAATNANYFRLNVGNAINALIPADDYGGTANTAFAVGTLNSTANLRGLIGNVQDQDFFTFTAGRNGTASFGVRGQFELAANVQLVGGGGTLKDNVLSFNVVSGQSYTVSLGTTKGIGTYDAMFKLDAVADTGPADLGAISFRQVVDQSVAGEKVFNVTASRAGLLTVETAFSQANGDINLEIYDAQNKLVASSRGTKDSERVDVTAAKGQAFRVRIVGTNADVDVRLTNLVTVSTNAAIVGGTAGDDQFTFATGTNHTVTVNGVAYSFAAKTIKRVTLAGEGGRDSLVATGTSGNESVTLKADGGNMKTSTYELVSTGMENTRVDAGTGRDVVYLYDSKGNDSLEARPTSVVLKGDDGSYLNQADGFDYAYIYASSGTDTAKLYDSAGNDRFDATSTYGLLQSTNAYYNYAQGFDVCTAYASGGTDAAYFIDSKGDDRFQATDTKASMTDSKGTYANSAEGFDTVYAYSRNGGNDSAILFDSAGNDTFTGAAKAGQMRGNDGKYCNYAEGFKNLEARAVNGGTDTAAINDVAATDKILGVGKDLTISRSSGKSTLSGFAKIVATSAAKVTATADIRAIDFVFQKVGRWK